MEKQEVHEKQFRGIWIPPEIMEAVENGTISIKEAWLLAIVESLVKYGGKDCFASNKYLAEKIKVKKRQLQVFIKHLKDLDLLIQTKFDGRRRHFQTAWSTINAPQRCRKMHPKGAEKCTSSPPTHYIENNKNRTTCPDPKAGTKSPSKMKKIPLHPRWKKFAQKLVDSIGKFRKVNITSKVNAWAKSFELLHSKEEISSQRIRTVLNWYCEEMQNQSKYLPIAYSGYAFRKKFLRIEDAMHRQGNSQNPPETVSETESSYTQLEDLNETRLEIYHDTIEKMELFPLPHMDKIKKQLPDLLNNHVDHLNSRSDKLEVFMEANQTGRNRGLFYQAEVIEQNSYCTVPVFCNWMIDEIQRWEHWAGSLKEFFSPNGKHFKRYINWWMAELDYTTAWHPDILEIMLET
jgi:hypothetical protein